MRTFLYLLFFSLAGLNSFSQSPYFLYIQSDDRLPFYVRLDEKIYSSSLTGYLLIGKLKDSHYDITVGFAKNLYPEQKFRISMNKKDKGFQLKQLADKGWALVNLQNQAVVTNTAVTAKDPDFSGERKTDQFSVLLSRVVNDSAILYPQSRPQVTQASLQKAPGERKPENKDPGTTTPVTEPPVVAKKEEKTTVASSAGSKEDTSDVNFKIKEATQATIFKSSVAKEEDKQAPLDRAFITKIQERKTAGNYSATYIAQYNYTTDTIDVLIPSPTSAAVAKTEESPVVKDPVASPDIKKERMITADSSRPVVLQIGSVTDTFKVKKKIIMINSDCKNFASENDVDKLRVRVIAEKNIDDKLAAARKYFRNKCFTVQQIRALTELFSTDEMKYRFLDLSYAFASDSGNYYLLEEVITDDYYKKRFQAMVRK